MSIFKGESSKIRKNQPTKDMSFGGIVNRSLIALGHKAGVLVGVVGDGLKVVSGILGVVLQGSKLTAHKGVDVLALLAQHPLATSFADNELGVENLHIIAVVDHFAFVTNTQALLVKVKVHINFHDDGSILK
jgi:hypothetical protein